MVTTHQYECTSEVEASARDVYDWYARPGALERLTPPWESVTVLDRRGGIADGSRVSMQIRLAGPMTTHWVAGHEMNVEGLQFCDRQLAGPFDYWLHAHQMEPLEPGEGERCLVKDLVEYRLPLSPLSDWLAAQWVQRRLDKLFRYRQRIVSDDLALRRQYGARMQRILVSGSTGLIGGELISLLKTQGHLVSRLTRSVSRSAELQVPWDPVAGTLDANRVENYDAVIHLAGENIAGGRWTPGRKRRILESRVKGTRLLAETLAACKRPPRVFVCASAMGYYGERGEETLLEDDPPGRGFLAEVCQQWEAACEPLRQAGVRVIHLRMGAVLSPRGGALALMLPLYRVGLGGRLGDGHQWMSWISIDDAIGAIHHALMTESLAGAVNVSALEPVPNATFAKTLGAVLNRPAALPAPKWALRLALGRMADELLLASARMEPLKLIATGYRFRYPQLVGALQHLLGR